MFADAALSRRLEALAADEMIGFVEAARALDPASPAEAFHLAGGVAVYLAHGSPVNQALNLGMSRELSVEEVAALEDFYRERGQRGLAVLSPLADGRAFAAFAQRGWTVDGFENVLVREYAAKEPFPADPAIEIVEVTEESQRELWVELGAIGFSAPLEPLAAQYEIGRLVAARPGATLLIAYLDGHPAGIAELSLADGVAWLSADATLPQFRRRGVQRALQAHRLRLGAEAGCSLAVSEALPGSGSQRNMERAGFHLVYTRVDLLAPETAAQ